MAQTFLCCLSLNTGIYVIGALQLKAVIAYLILLAIHAEGTHAFYIPPAIIHGIVGLSALACLVSKGRESEHICRRIYYYSFTILIALGIDSYWLVVIRQYPEFGKQFCYGDSSCIETYISAKLGGWVVVTLFNIYCAYSLMRFAEQDNDGLAELKHSN